MNMKEDWLNRIRESQADFSEPEPEGLWEGIEAGLEAEAVSRRKVSRWWWVMLPVAAAVALVLFLSVPGFESVSDTKPSIVEAVELIEIIDSQPITSVGQSSETALLAYSGMPRTSKTNVSQFEMSEAVAEQKSSGATMADADKTTEESSKPRDVSSPNKTPDNGLSENRRPENLPSENWPSESDKPARRARRSGFSLGLLASNVAGSRSSSSEYAALYGSTVTRQIHGFSETSADFPDSQGYAGVMQSNSGNEISSTVRNWQPVQVGVSVAYSFTDRLSIESGLTYSCLVSDLSSGTPSGNYDIRQTLHYIGLPLSLKYEFLKVKGFSLYALAGGQMEKCVAGKTRTDYFIDGKKVSSENGRIMVEPLQWSVGAYVGAQYSFNRLVGLYVEPGAAYYFRNGSPVNCIYSERPFNFSLRAGLRFSL